MECVCGVKACAEGCFKRDKGRGIYLSVMSKLGLPACRPWTRSVYVLDPTWVLSQDKYSGFLKVHNPGTERRSAPS